MIVVFICDVLLTICCSVSFVLGVEYCLTNVKLVIVELLLVLCFGCEF